MPAGSGVVLVFSQSPTPLHADPQTRRFHLRSAPAAARKMGRVEALRSVAAGEYRSNPAKLCLLAIPAPDVDVAVRAPISSRNARAQIREARAELQLFTRSCRRGVPQNLFSRH